MTNNPIPKVKGGTAADELVNDGDDATRGMHKGTEREDVFAKDRSLSDLACKVQIKGFNINWECTLSRKLALRRSSRRETPNEYAASSPAVICAAPAPVIESVAPSPADAYATPSTASEYVAPAPADAYAAPGPVFKYVASSTAVTYEAPAPLTGYVASEPAVTFTASGPVIEHVGPSPADTCAAPVTEPLPIQRLTQ